MKRMKWLGALVLTAGMIVLLLSCAGLPEPTEDTDTLVIGTFVVDFPEGFFRERDAVSQSFNETISSRLK